MKFQWVKRDTIFRHNEALKAADKYTKDTLQQVEVDIILVTSEKGST